MAIVDNNRKRANGFAEYVKRFCVEEKQEIETCIIDSGIDFASVYIPENDIVVIEVEMPLMNGIAVAERIRKVDKSVCIILIADTAQYALLGYGVDALCYLIRKSHNEYKRWLLRAVKAVQEENARNNNKIIIRTKDGFHRVNINDVRYVEACGHKIIYKLPGQTIETWGTLKSVEELFIQHGFYRCNKSYLVNMNHVTNLSRSDLTVDNTKIYISRQKVKGLHEWFTENMNNIGGNIDNFLQS